MIHGLLLAAGAGRRMGRPKALLREPDGTAWLVRALRVLDEGGCGALTVVLGAGAAEAEPLLTGAPRAEVVRADDWAEGMGASLRRGLAALEEDADADAALVHLVDLPDVTAAVVARMCAAASGPGSLARATYAGRPGHPVLLGRDHWRPLLDTVAGDEGARTYLRAHGTTPVECGDLATGHDVDAR